MPYYHLGLSLNFLTLTFLKLQQSALLLPSERNIPFTYQWHMLKTLYHEIYKRKGTKNLKFQNL